MKRAIGTSLVAISLSTLTGAIAYHGHTTAPWSVIALFTLLAIVGTLIGTRLTRRVPGRHLRRAFGVLVVILAGFLLYQNRTAGARVGTPAVRRSG